MDCHRGASLCLLRQELPRRIDRDRLLLRVTLVTAWAWAWQSAPLLCSPAPAQRRLLEVSALLSDILCPQLKGWGINLTHLLDPSLSLESKS